MKKIFFMVFVLLGGISAFLFLEEGRSGKKHGSFTQSFLEGSYSINPTSLQFGPDNRLYVSHRDGLIIIYAIKRKGKNNYQVVDIERIKEIQKLPNHNDQGKLEPEVLGRLVTGICLAGTSENPLIYVASSDPRFRNEQIDTNSGILSLLSYDKSFQKKRVWQRKDLVRGFPRSKLDHAMNGMQLDSSKQILYIALGGNTNMGTSSKKLYGVPDYALSGAVVKVDLKKIEKTPYDLPTLDDESRLGDPDFNDPFGGNRGKNQAHLLSFSPVSLYATGFRNPYDLVLTQNKKLYVTDNGANVGLGGLPDEVNNPEKITDSSSSIGLRTLNTVHLIEKDYYGGIPNPTRANRKNTFNVKKPQSPVLQSSPKEAYFIDPKTRKDLVTFYYSLNGITEYQASNFGGQMQGQLIGINLDKNLYKISLNDDGKLINKEILTDTRLPFPLDVTTTGDKGPFPGTIWVIDYPSGKISIFEPADYLQ